MSYVLSFMSFQQEPFAPLRFLKKNLVAVPDPKRYLSKISHHLYIRCQIKYEK